MKQIRIILTSVGGLVVPSMIQSLKQYFEDIYIVGVDASKEAVGFYFTDASYIVPNGFDPNFSSELLDIAIKEKIQFIIPASDEETLELAKNKKIFEVSGIKPLCSDYDKCKIAFNKGKMLSFLKEKEINVPEFRIPANCEQLMNYASELGYPEKKIVFKPNFSRGARGFWILDENYDEKYGLLYDRNRQTIRLNRVYEVLSRCKSFPSILLMEYLDGEDFNVDVLAKGGESFYIIPNVRLVPEAGPVQIGLVKKDEKVYELVKEIVEVFRFDYYLNIEVAYNTKKNIPMIYEINARIGAAIVINATAGVNLLAKGIELALNMPIEKNLKVQETKMIRYWNEFFIKNNNNKNNEKYFRS